MAKGPKMRRLADGSLPTLKDYFRLGWMEGASGRSEPRGRGLQARQRRKGWEAWHDWRERDEGPPPMGEENIRRVGGDPGLLVARDRARERRQEREALLSKGVMPWSRVRRGSL